MTWRCINPNSDKANASLPARILSLQFPPALPAANNNRIAISHSSDDVAYSTGTE
jgi:hypothetical protein